MVRVIHKHAICPIIVPTEQYIDCYGNQNSYIVMNPSLVIQPDGTYICMVRTVNYLKYKNKAFKIYGKASNSLYTILRGKLRDSTFQIDDAEIHSCNVQYNIPTASSLWYGIEDIRWIDERTILACIPECNQSVPCIFQGTFDESTNTCTNFEKCSPSHYEKNWMPFGNGNSNSNGVIYSVSPFVVKDCVEDTRTTIPISEELLVELEGFHGSTNGIQEEDGGFLFLIHKNISSQVVHKWLRYNPMTNVVSCSESFVFFPGSYIEFPCSLSAVDSKLFIGLGVNDNQAMIVTVTRAVVEESFLH